MKFNEFIENVKRSNGIDMDGWYGKQCMDLYNYYCVEVLELERGKTGADCAKNILNNAYIMQNMQRIDNYPEFIPQKGDIAVWCGGTYGHVAICLGEADVNKFKTIDQNWQIQQLTEEWHNYINMGPLVFLRPLNQKNIKESETFLVRVDKAEANVRTAPNTKSATVPQPGGFKCLKKGDKFEAVELVHGENVQGIDTWYKSKKGNYVWSYGLTRI